jgi:RNA polymerase sigma factor (sigma-70 family)
LVAVSSTHRAPKPTPDEGGLRRAAPQADATSELYERYAGQIYTYCFHQLGNREEAEDATQSTFLNAFRGLKRGIDPEFETAWLYKIAQNVCLTRQRSTSRRRRVETPGDLEAVQDFVPAHQVDPDDLISLPEALVAMPEQQRRALLLREWQGLSYKEIADELDLTQAAVETLLFRARRSLAAGLTEELPRKQPKRLASRLRVGGDASSLLALLKTLLFTGGAKVAATVATVAAASAVAATPGVRHVVEHLVAPSPHRARPQLAVPQLSLQVRAGSALSVPARRRPVLRQVIREPRDARKALQPSVTAAPVAHPPRPVEPRVPESPAPPAGVPPISDPPVADPPAVDPPIKLPAPAPTDPLPPAAVAPETPAEAPVAPVPTEPKAKRTMQDASPDDDVPGLVQTEAPGTQAYVLPAFVPPGQAKKHGPPVVDPGSVELPSLPLPPGQAKKVAPPAVPVDPPLPLPVNSEAVVPPPPAAVVPVPVPPAPQPLAAQPPAPDPAGANAGGKGNSGAHAVGQGHRK